MTASPGELESTVFRGHSPSIALYSTEDARVPIKPFCVLLLENFTYLSHPSVTAVKFVFLPVCVIFLRVKVVASILLKLGQLWPSNRV